MQHRLFQNYPPPSPEWSQLPRVTFVAPFPPPHTPHLAAPAGSTRRYPSASASSSKPLLLSPRSGSHAQIIRRLAHNRPESTTDTTAPGDRLAASTIRHSTGTNIAPAIAAMPIPGPFQQSARPSALSLPDPSCASANSHSTSNCSTGIFERLPAPPPVPQILGAPQSLQYPRHLRTGSVGPPAPMSALVRPPALKTPPCDVPLSRPYPAL